MANQLGMYKTLAIKTLRQNGMSQQGIADALGIWRGAVNLSLVFPKATSLYHVSGLINRIAPCNVRPIPNLQVMENLKFSECLSDSLAVEVFTSRFDDRAGVLQAVQERRRVVV